VGCEGRGRRFGGQLAIVEVRRKGDERGSRMTDSRMVDSGMRDSRRDSRKRPWRQRRARGRQHGTVLEEHLEGLGM
jgi:hypothetical protein